MTYGYLYLVPCTTKNSYGHKIVYYDQQTFELSFLKQTQNPILLLCVEELFLHEDLLYTQSESKT
jgi:hypothetical protein